MSGIIPVTGMYHLGVVTDDYKKSMEAYSRIFGIPRWEIRKLKNEYFGNPRVHGKAVKQNFLSVLGTGGPISFELCQPLAGDGTLYAEYLEEHGTGLHHVSPTVMSQADFDRLLPELEKRGLGFSQSADISDTISYWYVDSDKELGTPLELITLRGDKPAGRDPDEIVEFGPEVTHAPNRLPIDKLYHYTVVARQSRDLMRSAYEDLLGVDRWYGFESIPGESVVEGTYNGEPDTNRFKTWSGRKGALGVEIVEPLGGASMFEEKLNRSGPGIQHIMTTITSAEKWAASEKWLAAEGCSIAHRAWTPDHTVEVIFVDGRNRLDNMYLEVLVQHEGAAEMVGPEADILLGN
ncbi:VOC family protein [Novosphingobium sp. PASSN1]|uniref:VOC family protein n=1 Tax=Novosphingobium sp. PASSN1 TaxID=2015561 RepID=UPI000BD83EBB|nr:VOC family protein [Novosphingobium sp. PASSN1]OYU34775.1 MAG: hypothetical protein CFE35_12850 [Novosphingobium sp. PASSN1]